MFAPVRCPCLEHSRALPAIAMSILNIQYTAQPRPLSEEKILQDVPTSREFRTLLRMVLCKTANIHFWEFEETTPRTYAELLWQARCASTHRSRLSMGFHISLRLGVTMFVFSLALYNDFKDIHDILIKRAFQGIQGSCLLRCRLALSTHTHSTMLRPLKESISEQLNQKALPQDKNDKLKPAWKMPTKLFIS